MPDFGDLADKAKDAASDHEEQIDGGIDKTADAAGDKVGHEEQIDQGAEKLKGLTGDDN